MVLLQYDLRVHECDAYWSIKTMNRDIFNTNWRIIHQGNDNAQKCCKAERIRKECPSLLGNIAFGVGERDCPSQTLGTMGPNGQWQMHKLLHFSSLVPFYQVEDQIGNKCSTKTARWDSKELGDWTFWEEETDLQEDLLRFTLST